MLSSFILRGAHITTHLRGLLRLELRLHIAPIFTYPDPPADLLLEPSLGLLSSLLLFGNRCLFQSGLPSYALWPPRKMWLGLIACKSLRNGQLKVKTKESKRKNVTE